MLSFFNSISGSASITPKNINVSFLFLFSIYNSNASTFVITIFSFLKKLIIGAFLKQSIVFKLFLLIGNSPALIV